VASWTPYGFTGGWKLIPAISMNCDNQTVIIKVNSSRDNMKSTRHVKRRLKSVRKLRNSRVIALNYVHTSKNLADQFTKGLSRNVIDGASREMGLRPTWSHSIVVTYPMWSEIPWSRMAKQASGWLWWRDPYNKVQIVWDAHFSYAIRQVGLYLNVIWVAYLSRDVGQQDILEGTHIYEFGC
jgi:hypothetical protein